MISGQTSLEVTPFTSSVFDISKVDQRLTPHHRLHFRHEFLKFFVGSEVLRIGPAIVFRIPNDQVHFRLGLTFKAKGSSVERNRVRRRVREFFRTHVRELGTYDYNVVIPRAKEMSPSFASSLVRAFEDRLLPRISVRND